LGNAGLSDISFYITILIFWSTYIISFSSRNYFIKNVDLLMPKLARISSSSGNLFEQKPEIVHYKGMSAVELGKVFVYLNSVSFNYPLGFPPKMDKTMGSSKKL
jgi:hypothetical protein